MSGNIIDLDAVRRAENDLLMRELVDGIAEQSDALAHEIYTLALDRERGVYRYADTLEASAAMATIDALLTEIAPQLTDDARASWAYLASRLAEVRAHLLIHVTRTYRRARNEHQPRQIVARLDAAMMSLTYPMAALAAISSTAANPITA